MSIYLHRMAIYKPRFTPARLFVDGSAGGWWEPSPNTAYTDTAGTTSAGVGDAVARVDDSSGNGNHLTQGTAAARPILRQTGGGLYYLEFDGVDDFLSVSFLTTGPVSRFMAFRPQGSPGGVFFSSTGNATGGGLRWSPAEIARIAVEAGGYSEIAPSITSGTTVVLTLEVASTSSASGRRNGVDGSTVDPDDNYLVITGYAVSSSDVGLFGSGAQMDWFGSVVVDKITTTEQRSNTEIYLADLCGVTL